MNQDFSKELRRCNYLMSETESAYHEAASRFGLPESSMIVLYAICYAGNGCCPLRDICLNAGVSKQTINSALRRLEGEGAVRLEPGQGRGKNVRLTEKGRALAERTVLPLMRIEDEIYSSWSREDVLKNLELTERFLAALREKTRQLEQ